MQNKIKFPTIYSEIKRLINVFARGLIKRNIIADEIIWDRMNDIEETETVMSVCMMVRHDVLQQIGKIPSDFWTYYSNDYICHKASALKYKCFYIKNSDVIHYERFSDINNFSNKSELRYKLSPIPIEAKMQKDRFVFLEYYTRGQHEIFVYKVMSILEYLMLYISAIIKKDYYASGEIKKVITGILHY